MNLSSVRTSVAVLSACVALGPARAAAGRGELPQDEPTVREAWETLRQMGGRFEVHETAHYTIIYNGEKSIAIQRGQLLEALQRSYFRFLRKVGIEHHPLDRKLVVLVFEREEDFIEYHRRDGLDQGPAGGTYLQGYYNAGTNRGAFFNQRRGGAYERSKQAMQRMAASLAGIPGPNDAPVRIIGPDGVERRTKGQVARELVRLKKEMIAHFERENLTVTQHEGAHQLAFNTGLQQRDAGYPFWVSEGLACMFETPGDAKGFGAFRVNSERLKAYREVAEREATLGLKRLVMLDTDLRADLIDLYAESWALFFFLAKTRPKGLSAYLQSLARRGGDHVAAPPDEWELFAHHFRPDKTKLEQRWRNFLKRLR